MERSARAREAQMLLVGIWAQPILNVPRAHARPGGGRLQLDPKIIGKQRESRCKPKPSPGSSGPLPF